MKERLCLGNKSQINEANSLINFAKTRLSLKKILFIAIPLLLCACGGIEGTWIMESKNPTNKGAMAIIFNSDGTFALKTFLPDRKDPSPTTIMGANGQPVTLTPIDGQDIPGTGKWRLTNTGTYETDDTKTPHWLDLLVKNQNSNQRVEMIYNMPSNEVLQLGIGYGARPESFEKCRDYYPMRRATYEESQQIAQQ